MSGLDLGLHLYTSRPNGSSFIAPQPIAVSDTVSLDEGNFIVIPTLANDSAPADAIDFTSVTLVSLPTNGIASVNPTTGDVTYTPDTYYYGTDTFFYRFFNVEGRKSNVGSFFITVNPIADTSQTITFGETVYAGIFP